MPKITTFDAPQGLALRPNETGIQATAGAARRLQGDYSEAAAATEATGRRFGQDIALAGEVAVKYTDNQQITQGARAYAGMVAGKTKEWNDAVKNADPNDPTVGAKFLEENLEPALEKFKTGFITENGQKWAESHVAQLREHMFAKTSADMATLAGEAAKTSHRQTVNGLASAAYNDPSSLDFSLRTLESTAGSVVDSSPNLTGTAAAKVKTELLQAGKEAIVKAAVFGMIEKNPNVDLSAVEKKYGEYVTGPEMRQFAKAAQSQAKVDALRTKQADVYQKQLNGQAAHQAANKVMTEHVSIDPVTNRPLIKPGFFSAALELAKLPDAPDGLARTVIDWGEAQQNKDIKVSSDAGTRADLYGRIGAADKPTTEIDILRAEADRKLSHTDASQLRALQKAVQDRPEGESIRRGRDEFWKRYAATIDGAMDYGGHSALGSQRIYEAQMDARRQEEDLRKAGKDGSLVYDPRSEYFFGKPSNLGRYHVSLTEGMNYQKQIQDEKKAGTTNPSLPGPLPSQPVRAAAPPVGEVRNGYRFKGGDPSKPGSWEKVAPAAAAPESR